MKKIVLILFVLSITSGHGVAQNITGTATVNVGDTQTYTFYDGAFYMNVNWLAGTGSVITKWNTGNTYYASVQWNTPGTTAVVAFDQNMVQRGSLSITVNVAPPNTTFTQLQNCANTDVTRTSAPPTGVEWYWQTSSSGTSTSLGSGATKNVTSTAALYLRARHVSSGSWSTTSQNVGTISLVTAPLAAPSTATDGNGIGNSATSVPLSVATVSGATGYAWFTQSSGGTAIGGQTAASYSPSVSGTTTFYVATMKQNCPSTTRKAVVANLHPEPVMTSSNSGDVTMGAAVTLSATNYSYNTYQWLDNAGNVIAGATSSTYPTAVPGNYKVRVTKGNSLPFTPAAPIVVLSHLAGQNMNFIVSNTILADNITDKTLVQGLPVTSVSQSVQYFDELGRPLQTVVTLGGPDNSGTKKDVVQSSANDEYGRETRKYLPYTDETNGRYKVNALKDPGTGQTDPELIYRSGMQYAFFQTGGKLATDKYPYAETRFEGSPLNRVLKQGAPGQTWLTNSSSFTSPTDTTIAHAYEANLDNEVLLWSYTSPTANYPLGLVNVSTTPSLMHCAANKLFKNRTKDEHHNEVIQYVDQNGRLLLRRAQVSAGSPSTTDANKDTNYASTYYIYNDVGNLVCVIPPEAVKLITQASSLYFGKTDAEKDTFLKRWAFRYVYDSRGRMSHKQIPGAEPVYLVYDNLDRLVLTQDGNQRAGATGAVKYWSFTKYDRFNRPIATGIKDTTTTIQLTQEQMQTVVNTFYDLITVPLPQGGKPWRKSVETYVGTAAGNVHGYSNKSYPITTAAAVVNAARYLTVNYYDNYNFNSSWGARPYVNDTLTQTVNGILYQQSASPSTRVTALVTGTKVKILDGGTTGGYTWLKTVNYYDDRYRLIQSISDNLKGGTDRVSSLYDFTGKIIVSKQFHNVISWKDMVNATASVNKLNRSGGAQGWNTSGAASVQQIAAGTDGWIEFTTSESNAAKMIGLSSANPDANYTSMGFTLYIRNDAIWQVYENGAPISPTQTGSYAVGDQFRIERIGSTIKYYKNGALLYTSLLSSSTLLMADVAFYPTATSVIDLRMSPPTTTPFKTITRRLKYDHAGRLTRTYHQLDAGSYVLISQNKYNELGQLVDKSLHSVGGSAAKQSVDYRYNIRAWLTSINDASLTNTGPTNDDTGDLFGINLSYNKTFSGLGNTSMYNGNISGMTWSKNLGLASIKQTAYIFSYDAMNRLSSASHKQMTAPNTWVTGQYDENGLTYDLNGNIKSLQRKGDGGLQIDDLVYNYGTGATASNMLLYVQDNTASTTDKLKGFRDGNAGTATDYTYDLNGNMTRDLNKGIGTSTSDGTNLIVYNYLNLPETITKAGNSIRYIYDASGGKLSQVVTMGASVKQTDYTGECVYENNILQLINHEEGRIAMANSKLTYSNGFDVYNASDMTAINAGVVAYSSNGEKYVKVTSGNTTAGNGVMPVGGTFTVAAGDRYRVRVKGYRTSTNAVYLQVKAGTVVLNPSGATLPNSATTESSIENIVTIPTGGSTSMTVGLVWGTVAANDIFYLNELEITKLESITPEYQYHLKDHLGNVRLTFTSKTQTPLNYTAGFETANQATEAANFPRYPSGGQINTIASNATTGSNSQLLNGGYNGQIGIAKTFAVMPGDQVQISAYAKYSTPSGTPGGYSNFVASLLSAFSLSAPAGGEIGTPSYGVNAFANWEIGAAGNINSSDPVKAFVTIILFDKNYNFIDVAYAASTSSGSLISKSYIVREAGYAYLYVSNEHPTLVDVYTDDVNISHTPSAVVQMDDYYPFGLTFNSYQRENSLNNQFQYNGKEKQDELGLQWLDYGWRRYDPAIARWMAIDPWATKYKSWSPYNYGFDNPVRYADFMGLGPEDKKGPNGMSETQVYSKDHTSENKTVTTVTQETQTRTTTKNDDGTVTTSFTRTTTTNTVTKDNETGKTSVAYGRTQTSTYSETTNSEGKIVKNSSSATTSNTTSKDDKSMKNLNAWTNKISSFNASHDKTFNQTAASDGKRAMIAGALAPTILFPMSGSALYLNAGGGVIVTLADAAFVAPGIASPGLITAGATLISGIDDSNSNVGRAYSHSTVQSKITNGVSKQLGDGHNILAR